MSKVVAITANALSIPLALTGVSVREVAGPKEAETAVSEHLKDGTEVLIVQDTLRAGFSEWFSSQLARHRGKPLLVSCPSFEEEKSDVDAYLNSILRPAIGYEIRLE